MNTRLHFIIKYDIFLFKPNKYIYLMDDSIDLNVYNYSQEDLLSLLDLTDLDDVTYQDIIDSSTPIITRYTSEDNYDLANFFQQIQNRLVEELDYDSDNDVNDNDINLQDNESNQLGNLWNNQYNSQQKTDTNQANKTTDRTHQVNVFEQDDKFVMNRNELGIANNYQVPVAQGKINPNLKNTTTRLINIDSQYRENITPFNPDLFGPSSSSNFTLDLTDILRNTISIEMTSFQIPYTWYLIDGDYQANNCFYIDNSMVSIQSGNYTNDTIISEINTSISNAGFNNIVLSLNTISGKTIITNNDVSNHTITFYDPYGIKQCNSSCKLQEKFNNNLGWILGFRGNTDFSPSEAVTNPLYGQLVYTVDMSGGMITSESFIDTFGSKYFLLVLDDYNQNHLNKGLVGITPTQKYAEIPSYWNTGLRKSENGCTTPEFSSTKKPTYIQNVPRKLTQAQLYTLNETTAARTQTKKNFLTTPTTTDVLALIPLRLANNLSPGQQIIDDFNLDEAKRVYFGPVDIERMRVRLVNDKGYTVNLNGNDWSFTLTATALYQY